MAPVSFTCRYCGKPNVSRSLQGLKSHISQTPECRARRDEEHLLLNRDRSARADSQRTRREPVEHHPEQENLEEGNVPPTSDTDERPSKRARVDSDNNDENFRPTSVNFIVDYPAEAQAGAILQGSQDGLETRFEKIQRVQQHAGDATWAPFSSLADWELSRWLVQSGVSQREIDKFLKLEAVRISTYHVNVLC